MRVCIERAADACGRFICCQVKSKEERNSADRRLVPFVQQSVRAQFCFLEIINFSKRDLPG